MSPPLRDDGTQRDSLGSLKRRPSRLLRLAYRLPAYAYRLRLGQLLGYRFLLLTHKGRRTGRIHQTVLEVVRYDETTRESVVASAYGKYADWYRNIKRRPALEIQTGRWHYAPSQRFLTPEEVYAEFIDYERRHPLAIRILPKLVGLIYDGSEPRRRALTSHLRMVSFRPKESSEPE